MIANVLIYLVVFDGASTKLGKNLYPDLKVYIDNHYVEQKCESEYLMEAAPVFESSRDVSYTRRSKARMSEPQICAPVMRQAPEDDFDVSSFYEENESRLKERMSHLSDSFQQYLMYLIELKGLSNAQVYKRAIISKQLFSKIKLNPDYHPDKATAMRLCIGVGLNMDETRDLLARAGYALSPCDKRDVIFSFFIEHKVFDMIEIDIALEEHGLPCFIE